MNRWTMIGVFVIAVGALLTGVGIGVAIGQAMEREERPVQPEDFAAQASFRMPEEEPVRFPTNCEPIDGGPVVRCPDCLEVRTTGSQVVPGPCPFVRDGVELDCTRNGHRVRCDRGLEEDAPGYLPPSTGPDALHLPDRRK